MLVQIRHSIAQYVRKHLVLYFFVTLIFVIGIIFGALAVKTLADDQKIELVQYLKTFFVGLSKDDGMLTSTASVLHVTMVNHCKTIGILFGLGFTVIGMPVILFMVFVKGFVIGFAVGFLANEYAARGVLFAVASIMPQNVLAIPAIMVMAVSSLSFSLGILKLRRQRNKTGILQYIPGYLSVALFMLLLSIAAAFIETYISPVLMKAVTAVILKE